MASKPQRLFVKSRLGPRPRSSLSRRRRTISSMCCDARPATRSSCSTARTANGAARLSAGDKKTRDHRRWRADAAANRRAGSALSLRAAEARPPRLYGAKGDRDGGSSAQARDHAAHGRRARQHRPAPRQCHRGRRAMRDVARAGGGRAGEALQGPRGLGSGAASDLCRRGGARDLADCGAAARRRARSPC